MSRIVKIKRREERDGLCDRCVRARGELWTACELFMCAECLRQHTATGTCGPCLDAYVAKFSGARSHD